MFVIALTGGIGSGKTTVSEIFKTCNIPIIDTDLISRQAVEIDKPAYNEIIEHFGKDILHADGGINRAALRKLIFTSKNQRDKLEKILHPRIWDEVTAQLNLLTTPYCIVVVPLLLENLSKQRQVKFDRILVIDTKEENQINRVKNRDDNDEEFIKTIMNNQVSRKIRQNAADDIILNNDNIEQLQQEVRKLHSKYLSLAN